MKKLMLAMLVVITLGLSSALAENEDCQNWVNCNMNSPSFDGVCCRICYDTQLDHREWVCVRVSDDIGFPDEVRDRLPRNHDFVLDEDIDNLIENHVKRK
jgi:hypothetical protein